MDMKSSDASCISKRAQTKTIAASESTEELVPPRAHVRVCVQVGNSSNSSSGPISWILFAFVNATEQQK